MSQHGWNLQHEKVTEVDIYVVGGSGRKGSHCGLLSQIILLGLNVNITLEAMWRVS